MRDASYRFHLLTALVVGALVSHASKASELPDLATFQDGTPARAADVNDKFTKIRSAVNDNNAHIADHETRLSTVESANSAGNTMPDKQFRVGNIADIARGHAVTVDAGAITDFGPTGDYSALGSWQTSTFPAAMTLDFGALMDGIFEITFQSFKPADTNFIPSYSGAGSYTLEYSTDKTTWTNVPTVAPVQGDIFVHRLATTGVSARYIRLVVNAPNTPAKPVQISTFQVLSFSYGDSSAVDARRVYGKANLAGASFTAPVTVPAGATGAQVPNKSDVDSAITAKFQAQALGQNQAWSNVSRTANTVYTNDTVRPIMVAISVSYGGAMNNWNFVINGVTVVAGSTNDIYGDSDSFSFIVPPGNTYQFNSNTGGGIARWSELR